MAAQDSVVVCENCTPATWCTDCAGFSWCDGCDAEGRSPRGVVMTKKNTTGMVCQECCESFCESCHPGGAQPCKRCGERRRKTRSALQRAWRAHAGWHLGMVMEGLGTSRGGVVVAIDPADATVWVRNEDGREYAWGPNSRRGVPDLDAYANWGVWQQYIAKGSGCCMLEVDGQELDGQAHATCSVGEGPEYGAHPAVAMMAAYCLHLEWHGCEDCIAPEVLAWWKLEQGDEASP